MLPCQARRRFVGTRDAAVSGASEVRRHPRCCRVRRVAGASSPAMQPCQARRRFVVTRDAAVQGALARAEVAPIANRGRVLKTRQNF